jgi:hypothetical protein
MASHNPLEKGMLEQVLRASDLIGLLPWVTRNTLEVRGARWQHLPDVGFRQYNAGYTESTGDLEQWTEGVFPFGGDVFIEKQFTGGLENMLEDPAVTQMRMKLKALAMEFNFYFVEGVPALGGFTGIRHRIMNDLTARSRINLATAGDCLKVFASAATEHTFLDALHQGIKQVGGKANFILCNEHTYLAISGMLRRLGLLDTTKDNYERVVNSFMGAQIVDVGLRADQVTEIIVDTEDPGDAGNDATSLYIVRTGTPDGNEGTTGGDGLHGIQKNTLQAYDPLTGGEMEARPAYIRRIDWPVTIAIMGDQYCIARVYGFRMAAT